MASKKPTPKVSRISRDRTVAYARRQKPGSGDTDDAEPSDEATPAADDATTTARDDGASNLAAPRSSDAGASAAPAAVTAMTPVPAAATAMTPVPAASAAPTDATAPMPALAVGAPAPAVASAPTGAGAASEDAPAGDRSRARIATVAMPVQASIGAPPAMPAEAAAAAPAIDPEVAEAPTRMPGPREIPGGGPDDPASPPGRVPPGDSRSMRRRTERYEFALIYRMQTYVICRFGTVGTRGQWRVVEYPTSAAAAHAYAKEVSRFVSEGFSDYRD